MPVIPVTFKDTGRFVVNPDDLFITPQAVADLSVAALKKLTGIEPERILDPGCGTGVWGRAFGNNWNKLFISPYGVDINPRATIIDYEEIIAKSFLEYQEDFLFDLICGNPPFSSETNRALAEDFILHSMDLLVEGGYLGFLLKTEFFASERRMENLFRKYVPRYYIQYVPRIKWDGHQFNNTIEYGFFIWQKGRKLRNTTIKWLNWKTGEML